MIYNYYFYNLLFLQYNLPPNGGCLKSDWNMARELTDIGGDLEK